MIVNLYFTIMACLDILVHKESLHHTLSRAPCVYNVSLLGTNSCGLLHICNGIKGIIYTQNVNYVLNITSHNNTINQIIKPKRKIPFKIIIINEFSWISKYGNESFDRSEQLIRHTQQIFDILNFGDYQIELILQNIYNMAEDGIINRDEELRIQLDAFADWIEMIRQEKGQDQLISNLVLLFIPKIRNTDMEAASFIGGAAGENDGYGIIQIDDADEDNYHAKVIAHEILHSMGVEHDNDTGCLMEKSGIYGNDKIVLSEYTKIQMKKILKRMEESYKC
ncbi:Zinc metalloproteinase-disintegrin-like [Astathelohania contejeani]|uniref:Zinc metalloproteinase-disintegrin-like n=1 Tax=Astathelohania contejeani TaxID=164912 RepID=A0ABQ7I2A1_9MICR|nr:Zinc metalloproteinase-disintegrin-like [Thelohania contejeani]